jgi:cytochrome c-type biogenesis protein CcmH/NrfG
MSAAADLAFRQAFALCPSSPETVFRYVELLTTQADRWDDALAIARTAWELDRANPQVRDLVDKLQAMQRGKSNGRGQHENRY